MDLAIKLDKEAGRVAYSREYLITPFRFTSFPYQFDRFCIIILSSSKSKVLRKLFQFILNSHINETFVKGTSLVDIKKDLLNRTQSNEVMKDKLAILDLSHDQQFKDLHPSIVPCPLPGTNAWTDNHTIKTILIPNVLSMYARKDEWAKNYSHTIWLASSIDEIPKVLLTNKHMLFITEPEAILEYSQKIYHIDLQIRDIFVVTSILACNMQLMTLSKQNFI